MSIVKPRDQLSAFPWVCRDQQIVAKGMTLRDYFAAKAMQMHGDALSGIATDSSAEWDELIARRAYETADGMLKARDAS
jgi:hypothetical protein